MLELYLLIQLGRATGALTTIGIVVVTGVVGAALAKHEGLKTYYRIRSELNAGHLPGDQLIDALLILMAGAVLITPGLISDGIGIALLVPHFRRIVRQRLKRRFAAKFTVMHFGRPPSPHTPDDIVDVEVREIDRKTLDRNQD